jgi:hypothetical protein
MTPDECYAILRASILKAKADGLEIISGEMFRRETVRGKRVVTGCCAIGAVVWHRDMAVRDDNRPVPTSILVDRTGLDVHEIDGVMTGFDAYDWGGTEAFIDVGKRLRAEFIKAP